MQWREKMAHTVKIKDFSIDMEVKNKGVEFQVHIDDAHQGDAVVSKTGIEWCQGKTKVGNGKKISWKDFIEYMNNRE